MAIMVLVSAIAYPSLAGTLDDTKLNTDARQMADVLRMARQQAITSGQTTTVVFYPANAKYKINGQSYVYLKSGIRFVGLTSFTTRFNGLPACSFSPTGAPGSGGTVTLTNGNNLIYIIVNPVAGRVRVSDTPPQT